MTPISLFRGPLRLMLDDWDAAVRRYPDAMLDSAVATMVQLGKLNRGVLSPPGGFAVTPDGANITPDVITGNPKSADLFALGTYHTVKLFLAPKPDRSSFRTRAVSGSTGNVFRYLNELEASIYVLENGEEMFTGYQSYYSWISSMAGLPFGEVLAQFNLQSPLWSATFTRDGMRVA